MVGRANRRGRAGRRLRPDVAGGAVVEVIVDRLGGRGDGIALAPDGRRLYVPKSLPGERVRVRIGEAQGDGVAAELIEILAPSPGRAGPPCPHFARCGGCALQHLDEASSIAWKTERLVAALTKADFADYELRPTVRVGPGERRRGTFTAGRAGRAGSPVSLGFAAARSHAIVDLATCLVLDPKIVALLAPLRALLSDILGPGQRKRIAVALLDGGLDLVLDWPKPPGPELFDRLARFAHEADVSRLLRRRDAGAPAEPIVQRRPVRAVFAGTTVAVPPGAFLQATARGEAALTEAVVTGVGTARSVADLFSGAGTFALPLAAAGLRVHGVDVDGPAIAALAAATRSNPRVTTERRNLFARPLVASELDRFDAVVFDPPRAGASRQAAALAASAVPVVVAVSCNPATFVRDARLLAGGGFRLATLTPVDQFLYSAHLELAAVFVR